MRVASIMSPPPHASQTGYAKKIQKTNVNRNNDIKLSPQMYNLTSKGNAVISFTGFAETKNMNDIASTAPESNHFKRIPEMCQGGLGVVSKEGPASFVKHEGKRVFNFYGIFNYNNPEGAYKFLYHPKEAFPNGLDARGGKDGKDLVHEFVDEKYFYTAKPGQTLEEFAKEKGFDPADLDYVIQSKPQDKIVTINPDGTLLEKEKQFKASRSPYIILRPTDVKDKIERMSEESIEKFKKIDCELFEARLPGETINPKLRHFFISTQNLAKRAKPYSYNHQGGGGYLAELANSEMDRAYVKLIPRLNTEKYGYFNPASHWLHCRPTFLIMNYIANESAFGNKYWNGTKTHATFHNPGKNYQGHTSNPLEFFRYVAEPVDIENLKKKPEYKIIKEIDQRGWYEYEAIAARNPKSEEAKKLRAAKEVLDSFLEGFMDDNIGRPLYNITMTPINAVKRNPDNMSAGTVSMHYGWEMKNKNMYQIADGLTNKLASIKTIDITNGSTPASLQIDNPDAGFGLGGNILTAKKEGFNTYSTDMPIEEIVKRKRNNTKWLLDTMAEASKEGKLNEVFFNSSQIKDGYRVLGELSAYKEGDMILMGWGRPDPQKGFPTSLEGFLEFLKSDAPEEVKLRTKILLGSGNGIWNKDDAGSDIHKIERIMKEIQELDGGKYAKNACYVDGFFPNRLIACATYGLFTSTFEPCGITPLEAFAAGTPSISIKTGGAPNFIAPTRGFLTKDAYLMNPEFYNLTWQSGMDVVDEARRKRSAIQIAKCIKDAAGVHGAKGDSKEFMDMVKDAITQKVDWHENGAYNNGVSANKRYMNEVWEIDKGWEARNKKPMRRLVGHFENAVNRAAEQTSKLKNKWTKLVTVAGIGIAAAGSGVYLYFRQKNKNLGSSIPQPPVITDDKKSDKPVVDKQPVIQTNTATLNNTNLLDKLKKVS